MHKTSHDDDGGGVGGVVHGGVYGVRIEDMIAYQSRFGRPRQDHSLQGRNRDATGSIGLHRVHVKARS